MPVDQPNAYVAIFDNDETDEENDTLGELLPSGSHGLPLSAGSIYIHGVRESDDSEAVEDMFTVDDGVFVLQQLVNKASLDNLTQSSVSLATPSVSSISLASLASCKTFLPIEGCYSVFLTHLCDMIDMYPTLQGAEVISSECYTTPMRLGIVHRFLLLELRRGDLKPIWIRLDRTRNKFTSGTKFILNGARTRANDVVQISAIKDRLIPPHGRRENQQVYDSPPHLGHLHHFMWVTVRELTNYRLASENCWFFVSLLQQHLNDVGGGRVTGRTVALGPDRGVAAKIRQQAKIQRELHQAASSPEYISIATVESTDLASYARYMLRSTPDLDINHLASKSHGSVIWLVAACLCIIQGDSATLGRQARLNLVPSGSDGLDALYATILGPYVDRDGQGLHLLGGPLRFQLRLAERCFDIMNEELRFNIANAPSSFLQNRDVENLEERIETNISPLLSCACRFWPLHASIAIQGGASIPFLVRFLKNQVLQWLEVMSLIQSSPEEALAPLAAITTAQPTISALIQDVMCFVKTFAAPIMSSVPHIYISALAFTPQRSVIASQQHLHPGLIQVKQGTLIEWPCPLQILEGHSSFVYSVAFSPDGTCIASGSADRTICLWDAQTGSVIGQPLIGHRGDVSSVTFSPNGVWIASGSDDGTVRLWDVKTGTAVGQPLTGHSNWVRSVAFSPDGTRIASGSNDNTVRLWDAHAGASIGEPMTDYSNIAKSITFSPDGAQLASGSLGNTIGLWDTRTGATIGKPLVGHSDWVNSIAYSPDGVWIASGSDDRTVRLWDARTGAAIGQTLASHSCVSSVTFSPDGARIASGSDDAMVHLWDARTGAVIGQPLTGHSNWVSSVAFSPDGTQIASGSYDGTVRVWDAALAVGQRGLNQHNTTEDSMPTFVSTNRSTSQSSDLGVGRASLLGAELEKYSPWRSSSGKLILKDGWIMGAAGELLLWIPSVHRKFNREMGVGEMPDDWIRDRFTTVDPSIVLDFHSFKCGTEWTQCRGSGAQ